MASAPKESSGTTPAGNAALTAETRDGVVSVAFSGNWKRGETGPDFLASRNEALEKAEKALSDRLSRRCHIVAGRKKGKIELEYYGLDDLNDLLDALAKPQVKPRKD